MSYNIHDVNEAIEELQVLKAALESGEECCVSNYSSHDNVYDCYCTGCGGHMGTYERSFSLPLKSQTYCRQCKKII